MAPPCPKAVFAKDLSNGSAAIISVDILKYFVRMVEPNNALFLLFVACAAVSAPFHAQVLVRWAQFRTQQARRGCLRRPLLRGPVGKLWRVIRFQRLSVHHPDLQRLLHGFQGSSGDGINDHQQWYDFGGKTSVSA